MSNFLSISPTQSSSENSTKNRSANMGKRPMVFRVDADSRIGIGHFMRCLALAQSYKDRGGQAVFAVASLKPALEEGLRVEGLEFHFLDSNENPSGKESIEEFIGSSNDAAQTAQLAKQVGALWIVADGYQFKAKYQKSIKDANFWLLLLDDVGHSEHYFADLVLNQNISADADLYWNRESHTRLLLGNSYTLLRREFQKWRGWERQIPPVAHKILVTLGGADVGNVTLQVLQAFESLKNEAFEIRVVIGAANPYVQELRFVANALGPRLSIQFVENAMDMAELMAWADLAISAAGSTLWEMAFMGLPNLLFVTAANQKASARILQEKGVATILNTHEKLYSAEISGSIRDFANNFNLRQAISQKCKVLVDGEGVMRVLAAQGVI